MRSSTLNSKITVRNCAGSGTLLSLQAKKLACAGRRHEIPRSEIKDLMTPNTAGGMSFTLLSVLLVLQARGVGEGSHRAAQVHTAHTQGFTAKESWTLGIPSFKGLLANLLNEWSPIYNETNKSPGVLWLAQDHHGSRWMGHSNLLSHIYMLIQALLLCFLLCKMVLTPTSQGCGKVSYSYAPKKSLGVRCGSHSTMKSTENSMRVRTWSLK